MKRVFESGYAALLLLWVHKQLYYWGALTWIGMKMRFVLISRVLQSVTTVLQYTREMNCLRVCCALYSGMVKLQVFWTWNKNVSIFYYSWSKGYFPLFLKEKFRAFCKITTLLLPLYSCRCTAILAIHLSGCGVGSWPQHLGWNFGSVWPRHFADPLHIAVPIAVTAAPGKDFCLEKLLACNEWRLLYPV